MARWGKEDVVDEGRPGSIAGDGVGEWLGRLRLGEPRREGRLEIAPLLCVTWPSSLRERRRTCPGRDLGHTRDREERTGPRSSLPRAARPRNRPTVESREGAR